LVAISRPASWEAERYRNLRRTVEHTFPHERRRVIGVTSPEAGEGKTTTAANLAAMFAEIPEHRVLAVDADFRCGSLSLLLGPGRSDLGQAVADEETVLAHVVTPGGDDEGRLPFAVAHSRPQPGRAHRIVESPFLAQLMLAARRDYDTVVVDCPPLLSVADCSALSQWIDGFLLIVAADKTRRDRLSEATSLIPPAKLLGLVFNLDAEPAWKGSKRYYMSYGPSR